MPVFDGILIEPSHTRVQPQAKPINQKHQRRAMLYTIVAVLLILWLLGLVTSTTMGGLVHVLLVLAIVVILFRVLSGRRAL